MLLIFCQVIRDKAFISNTMTHLGQLVAICGRRRAGKDTIADILCEHHGFRKVRIADSLKQVMKILFHFDDQQMECDRKDEIDQRWGISPRQAMQFFGTEVMQYKLNDLLPNIGRDFWIRSVIEKELRIGLQSGERIVIPDLRFLHEEKQLRDLVPSGQLQIWKVIRNIPTHTLPIDSHSSECEWKQICEDVLIDNNNDTSMLQKSIGTSIPTFLQRS